MKNSSVPLFLFFLCLPQILLAQARPGDIEPASCRPGWHLGCAPKIAGGCANMICVEDKAPKTPAPCDIMGKFNLICECHRDDGNHSRLDHVLSVKGHSWDEVRARASEDCNGPDASSLYYVEKCNGWVDQCK